VAAAGGRVGFALHQHSINRFKHVVQIRIDVAIPKPKHMKAGAHQYLITFCVAYRVGFQIVLTAVDLDD